MLSQQQKSQNIFNTHKIVPVKERFVLDNDTKNILKNMKPEFGFNGLGEVVFRRTYSRDNEDWCDVVIRVIEGMMSIRKDHFRKNSLSWCDNDWQDYASKMAVSMFKMEWLPPGRGLWMMGTEFAYNRGSMALNNCFSSETKFWTHEGLRSFSDFKDGDKTMVRGKDKWMVATVKSYGLQRLWKLTMGKGSATREVYTTANHRWLTKTKKGDGKYNWKVKSTEELQSGWKLQNFSKRTNFSVMQMCSVGIQHGIVFGDGTRHLDTDNCKIQLCGDKVELSRYFCTPRKSNKTITGLPNTWKDLPSLTMNKEYLFGFLAGWFATDGSVDKNCNIYLTNSDAKVLEWARDALFRLDILTSPISMSRKFSPYDGKENPNYCIHIYRTVIPDSFFLRDKHQNRFKTGSRYIEWKVVNVEPTERVENVWCVSEPIREEFTLEDGVLTKNCGATDTRDDFVHSAEWTMDALMNGVGVGFSTSWRGEATMPDKKDTEEYVIPDSREGWVESLVKLLCAYIDSPMFGKNKFPIFDYSKIRKLGEPIKGFGGLSSGPEPLKKLHQRVEQYCDAMATGRLECKSKTYKEVPNGDGTSQWKEVDVDVNKEYDHTRFIADVFNSIGACVVAGNVRRCLPGDAMVHTKKGLVPIKDIKVGDEVMTMEGYEKVSNTFYQGKQKLVKIVTQDGYFRCTPNHRMAVCTSCDDYEWKQASELTLGDRLISSRYQIDVKFPKWNPVKVQKVVDDTEEQTYDIEVENRHEFFCNGLLTHNSAEISLGDVHDRTFLNLKNYDENPERSAIGWMSNNSIALDADHDFDGFSFIPDLAQRIIDNGEPGIINMYNVQKYGRYGKEMPDKANLVNPCSEISLCNYELCNLSEIFPNRCKSPDDFMTVIKYATFYSSTVSLLPTHRPETNAIVAKNRRIGVSISGIAQWVSFGSDSEWGKMNYTRVTKFLRAGYKLVRQYNSEFAEQAGVPASIRVTAVKPSGTISLLAGATAGVHYPFSRYAIRRIRVANNSPLVGPLKEAGIKWEKDIASDNTLVFEFIIDHGDVRPCEEVSPWEQFSLVAMMQRCWSDNMVSATIYFDKKKDADDVEKLLAMFIPVLKSVSMLPHSGHGYAQAPYEKIDKETYEKRLLEYKHPSFNKVEGNVPVGSNYCTGDNCQL